MSRFLHTSLALSSFLWLPLCTQAHMQMSWPYPLRSPLDPDVPIDEKDYDMTSPLFPDGSNFPCKNYQNDTDGYVTKATYLAGGTYDMWINGTVEHDGGSCQLSLSYDNGATFKVIKSMIGGCPLTHNYNFTIPSFAPSSDSALLSWSWFNLVGDREMYQNCARVQIVGGTSMRHRRGSPYRRQVSSIDQLPSMFVCNVGNGCQTIERQEVVFPDPGTDVVYGQDAIVPDPGPGFTTAIPASAFTSQTLPSSTTTTTSDPAPSTSAGGSTTVDPAADLLFATTTSTTLNTSSTSVAPFLLINGSTTSTPFPSATGALDAPLNTTSTSVAPFLLTNGSTTSTPFPSETGVLDAALTTTSTSVPPFPLTNGSTTAAAFAAGTGAVNAANITEGVVLASTTTSTTLNPTTSTSVPPFPLANGSTTAAAFATGTGAVNAANITEGVVLASTTTSTAPDTTSTSVPPFPLTNGSTTAALLATGTAALFANLTEIVVFNLADSTTSSLMTTTALTTLLTTMTPTTTTTYEIANFFTTTRTTTRPTSSITRTTSRFSTLPGTSVTGPTTFTTLVRFDADASSTTTTVSPTISPTSLPLPCVPGTFTCNDPFSFSQCIGTGTAYVYMGSVALGTTCVNGQIIRENDGPCTPDGALSCNGERAFYLCDQGGLIDMGPVPPGTVCSDGAIVAST